MTQLHIPLEVVSDIIELVATNHPRSLPTCALLSRHWNVRAAFHLHLEKTVRVCVAVARLPIELLYRIIDLVAEHNPASLPSCALVSHQWNLRSTYHLQRLRKTFRDVTLTTIPELHELLAIANQNTGIRHWPTFLSISPDPEASISYIPFLDLSSRTFPNVNRLVWGEGLRWTHYPPLYNNGAVGSSFHAVTALDVHCRFKSARHLFRVVRSFKNLEEVRLLHLNPLEVAPNQDALNLNVGAHAPVEVKLQKPLQLLEIPLSVLQSIMETSGDYIVNLSLRCPPVSALVSMAAGGEPRTLPSSLRSLKTVSITVPTEPFNPANTGLQNLGALVVAPIHKVDVKYSLSLLRCTAHGAVGYRVEGLGRNAMLKALRTPAKLNPLQPCRACAERPAAPETRTAPQIQLQAPLPSPIRVASPVVSPESPPVTPYGATPYTAGNLNAPGPRPYGHHRTPAWRPSFQNVPVTLVNVLGTVVPDTLREREGEHEPTQASVQRFLGLHATRA